MKDTNTIINAQIPALSPYKGLNRNGKRILFSFVTKIIRAVRFKRTLLSVRVVNANERGLAFCSLLFAFCFFT